MRITVVDILCCESLYKIIRIRKSVREVYYYSLSRSVSIILRVVSLLSHIQFKDFSEIPASRLYRNQGSCYEEQERRLTYLCDLYFEKLDDDSRFVDYCRTARLNMFLAKKQLRQSAYWLLYRPVEILVKSEFLKADDGICFVLRKSPVLHILMPMLKKPNMDVILYQYLGFSKYVMEKEEYVFDAYIKEAYFNNPIFHALKTLRELLILVVNSFCFNTFAEIKAGDYRDRKNAANIGVDKYLRLAEEDCFWVEDARIDPETIYYFEERKPAVENRLFLERDGIRRAHIVRNPIEWLSVKRSGRYDRMLVSADWSGVKRSLALYVRELASGTSFKDGEKRWQTLVLLQMRIWSELWKDIFELLGLKVLISWSDLDNMNTAKTIAADAAEGLVAGGHLSNQPLYSVQTERFYHIAFAWGPHFCSHLFGQYPHMAVVMTGFYFDRRFQEYQVKAAKIRSEYNGNFIITLMDNVFYQDSAYSVETVREMYKLFFNIIDSYPRVILFVKTKRVEVFDKTRKAIPGMDNYIRDGRIVPFIVDSDTNQPYKPACIALASDLVIGLGISSAAAESQFAGTLSFHFDLSSTSDNEFARKALGIAVFRTSDTMREVIEKQINGETAMSYETVSGYYSGLDPFRDGRAAERVGAYLRWLQDGFKAGLSRETAIAHATENYGKQWGYDKVISATSKPNNITDSDRSSQGF